MKMRHCLAIGRLTSRCLSARCAAVGQWQSATDTNAKACAKAHAWRMDYLGAGALSMPPMCWPARIPFAENQPWFISRAKRAGAIAQ